MPTMHRTAYRRLNRHALLAIALGLAISSSGISGAALSQTAETEQKGAKELFYPGKGSRLTSLSPQHKEPPVPRPSVPTKQQSQPDVGAGQDALPFGLSYWIELVETPGAPGRQVTESRTFRSGERLRFHFRSNHNGYITLLQLGSSGIPSVLFPDSEAGLTDHGLPADQDRILPTPSSWFAFDDHPGTERLLVLFATQADPPEKLVPGLLSSSKGTATALASAKGRKDLFIEREPDTVAAPATYAVSLGSPLILLEVVLRHE